MFGFFIGTACLIGLVAVARRGRRHHFGRHGHHGCGHHGHGGRWLFHELLDRLDTTPGQEKVIRTAVDELRRDAATLRREARGTRSELAASLRAPELDRALLDQMFAKHDGLIRQLRESLLRATGQIHGALDDRQREKLADMIESGPWAFAGWR